MDKTTAKALYYVFAILTVLFIIFWLFLVIIPVIRLELVYLGTITLIFLNPIFYLFLGFGLSAEMFNDLKKQAEKPPLDFFYCTNCGFENIGTAKFCKSCGLYDVKWDSTTILIIFFFFRVVITAKPEIFLHLNSPS
ncbi:MAG: zinc ribbon domain-containing protein [Promethearchaeota archaeon]